MSAEQSSFNFLREGAAAHFHADGGVEIVFSPPSRAEGEKVFNLPSEYPSLRKDRSGLAYLIAEPLEAINAVQKTRYWFPNLDIRDERGNPILDWKAEKARRAAIYYLKRDQDAYESGEAARERADAKATIGGFFKTYGAGGPAFEGGPKFERPEEPIFQSEWADAARAGAAGQATWEELSERFKKDREEAKRAREAKEERQAERERRQREERERQQARDEYWRKSRPPGSGQQQQRRQSPPPRTVNAQALSPYAVLHLAEHAPEWAVRAIYKAAMKEHHPDRPGADKTGEAARRINQAFETIKKQRGWS